MSENLVPHLSYREMLNCRPYMVVIAFILQDAPDKMLTFCQLMDRLEQFIPGRPASFRNTIRATLSNNKCFVKIPSVVSKGPRSLSNSWKLDHSKITEEVRHRNFKGLLEWFPELASVKKETPPPHHYTSLHSPEVEVCIAVNSRCEVKLSSYFSIESILKKDSSSGLCCKASPPSEECSISVKVDQNPIGSWSTERTVGLKMKFNWDSLPVDTHLVQCTGDSSSSYTTGGSTDHGITGDARPTKRMFMSPEPPSAAQQGRFNKCKSYLAMIAIILQDSPEKMLTFSQLMDRLEAFGVGRTKSFENNIRVCLSSKKCFVKTPVSPGGLWNNWKLDHSKITEKMVRHHFKGLLELFPELTSVRKEMLTIPPPDHYTTLHSHEGAACNAVNSRCEFKFSSSFSIESILEKDSPSGLCCKASQISQRGAEALLTTMEGQYKPWTL